VYEVIPFLFSALFFLKLLMGIGKRKGKMETKKNSTKFFLKGRRPEGRRCGIFESPRSAPWFLICLLDRTAPRLILDQKMAQVQVARENNIEKTSNPGPLCGEVRSNTPSM